MGKKAIFLLAVVLALALPVIAPAKEVPQTVPSNDLLQFRSGGLIIGFAPDKVYMAGVGYLLTEEFVSTEGVRPVPEGGGTKGAVVSGSAGHKGAPELIKVSYRNLWPGITLLYEAKDGAIAESRYIIEPGADPGKIRIRYNGNPEIQKDGSIRFSHPTKRGYFTMSAPRAWQDIGGRRIPVGVTFHEYGDGSIGFKPEGYDRDYPLIIDPTYEWHTFYGCSWKDYRSGIDKAYGIAVDGSGNVYVTGGSALTWQGDGGADPLHAHSGGGDIFVLKLDSSGAYQWHTFYGSAGVNGVDEGHGIAVDGSGNVYVTGSSRVAWQGDGNTDPLHLHAFAGIEDIFVLKLDSSGAYQWHTFYGSAGVDEGHGIAIDGSGNVYVMGSSHGAWQGDGGAEPLHPHAGGCRSETDVFILKLNASGVYQWHTFYGYAGVDDQSYGNGIAVDGSGNVYVTGSSRAAWQGDGGAEPLHPYSGGFLDIFILKLDSSGAYQWHTFYGSDSDDDEGRGIAIDGSGNVYVTGLSLGTWEGDGGVDPLHPHAPHSLEGDIFILKLNASGAYQWHTFYGSDYSFEEGNGIAVDGSGNVYVTGYSDGTWQGDGGTEPLHPCSGLHDIFILKLNASGAYQWHTFYGSGSTTHGGRENGNGIAVDGSGNIYVTGYTLNTWQGDGGADPLHPYSDNYDIFVLKLGQPTNQPPAIDSFTADPTSGAVPLTVDFTCQAHDPDGTIASYQWDFDGDGTVDQTTTDGTATYTYDSAGSYQAQVTVVDDEGASTTSNTIAITVGSNLPFAANPHFRACHVLAMNTSSGVMTAIDAVVVDPNGTPPDTITTLTVSGPEGFSYSFLPSDYYSQFNDYWHAVQGQLASGEYTFTVTDNEGKTAVSHCYFSGGTNIPVPDISTLQATGDPLAPTLSWGAVSGYQGNLFYRARIYDAADNSIVWTSGLSPFTSVHVPDGVLQQGRQYTWRVEAFDNYTYFASNQRAVTDRIALEIDKSAPYFNWATVFHRKDSEGDWIQIEVGVTDPDGDVPSTISSLKVYDPQDRLIYSFQASEYYPRWDEYGTKFSGTPDPGVYKFVVTDTDGNTKTTYDYVAPSFDIPLVDSTTLQASGDATAPTLSWAAPAGMDRPLYYRVIVEDPQGNWIWWSDRINLTFVHVPAGKLQSGGSYRWYVRTIDDSYWAHFSNQGRSQRVDLTIDNSRPFFHAAAVYKLHEVGGVYTELDASISDPDGTLPGSLQSLTVTDPNNNTYDLLHSGTYYPTWSDFSLRVPGNPVIGVYTFTVQDKEGNTAVTHEWMGQSAVIPLVDKGSISVTGDPLAPTISWSGISGYEGNLYYRIWVQDAEGNYVYYGPREPYTDQKIPAGKLEPDKTYMVRVDTFDHRFWSIFNSRSNSDWVTWSTGAQPTNQSPIIDSFTANPTSGNAPLAVTFTCQAHDPDGTIASYQWDFDGDGRVDQTTTDGTATYTYDSEGTYQAKVTVVDDQGASMTSNTIAITVGSNAPFAANPPTPMDPIAFSWGTFPYPIPSDTPVTVAPGIISIAPKMNIPDCNDVAQPLMYAYLPDSQVGIDLSALVIESCNNGVATFAFPDIDLSNYPGLVFDIYYGYADGSGRIFYNTYEVTVSANPTSGSLISLGGVLFDSRSSDKFPYNGYMPIPASHVMSYSGYGEYAGYTRTFQFFEGQSVAGVKAVRLHVTGDCGEDCWTEDWWFALDVAGNYRILKSIVNGVLRFEASAEIQPPVFLPSQLSVGMTWSYLGMVLSVVDVDASFKGYTGLLEIKQDMYGGEDIDWAFFRKGVGLVIDHWGETLVIDSGWKLKPQP